MFCEVFRLYITLDFEKPFDLIPNYKSIYSKENLEKNKSKNHLFFPQKSQSMIWSGREDSNLRPLGPEPSALNQTALRPAMYNKR